MQHLDFQTCIHQHVNRMGNVWREEGDQHDRVRKKEGNSDQHELNTREDAIRKPITGADETAQ